MNENFKAFMEGIGVLTEFSFALYAGFMKAGFNPDQAMELTKTQLSCINSLISENIKRETNQKEEDDD